ncbi:MAG TPA: hypothetical protein DCE44_04010, partial [Verrucomicrobiales bacterium]|nr:hypothetical protein [Verrucomicrobiales bacterium]
VDIEKIHEAGLISDDQLAAIIAHFKLNRETNRFLIILGVIGAILVSAGIILLVSTNWDSIPSMVKLTAGLVLLVGAHGLGRWLERRGGYPALVEVCHLLGAGMFLANIALVGQVYHLSDRLPNAFLLWAAALTPFAFILRSRAQFILWLSAVGTWLATELDEPRSWLYFGGYERACLVYVILGVLLAGIGLLMRRSRFPEFAPPTEKFGLLMLHLASFPLTIGFFYRPRELSPGAIWVLTGITAAAAAVWLWSTLRSPVVEDRQWRWVWAAAQVGIVVLAWVGLLVQHERSWNDFAGGFGPHWIALPALFIFCLLQAHLGVMRRSPFLVNLAMVFIGIHLLSAYFQLFGSMETTGLAFVVTGIVLIGMAAYLERKRRSLIRRMRAA